jgi:hypothetical protein
MNLVPVGTMNPHLESNMADRFPVPAGCYVKPSGAIAAFPMIQVLPDPDLKGGDVRHTPQVLYVSPADFARRLKLFRRGSGS